jgi:hypothetical protein
MLLDRNRMAGYSGTPLARKLGLKEGFRVRIINAPKRYWTLLTSCLR